MRQPPAALSCRFILQQSLRSRIDSDSFDGLVLENRNPHLKIRSLFEQHVFLRRKQPQQISTAYLVAAITQQVRPQASRNEVQLQLGMVVPSIAAARAAIAPDPSIEPRRDVKKLSHGDKKR
jgi:hypothetical protein